MTDTDIFIITDAGVLARKKFAEKVATMQGTPGEKQAAMRLADIFFEVFAYCLRELVAKEPQR